MRRRGAAGRPPKGKSYIEIDVETAKAIGDVWPQVAPKKSSKK